MNGLGLGADRLVELPVGREHAGLQGRHLVGLPENGALVVPLAEFAADPDGPGRTYVRFLAELRSRLARRIALSITALPTWMNSAELERLTRDLDEIVLQVHAVDDPRRGTGVCSRLETPHSGILCRRHWVLEALASVIWAPEWHGGFSMPGTI